MKKTILFVLIVFSFNVVSASTIKAGDTTSYDFNTTKNIIKEVMKSYYLRQDNIQYHNSRRKTPGLSPEDATSQDRQYTVCSGYTYNSYYEAFNMKELPRTTDTLIGEAANSYNNNKKCDGTFLIYYENTSSNIKSMVGNKTTFNDLVNLVQPGDIFVFSGHAMMAYDVVTKSDGKKDVLLLNSNGIADVFSRLYSTRKIFYTYDPNREKNGVVDVDIEGGIQYKWLSDKSSRFVSVSNNTVTLKCQSEECVVIRPFYNKNGKTVFNYDIESSEYDKSQLRLNYPGVVIDKTVNKGDNNGIYLGDKLTYTIKITNKSNATNKGKDAKKYGSFTITETIDSNYVTFDNSDVTYSKSGNNITWKISGLAANETKTIKYTVKVNNKEANIGKKISSTGKFYGSDSKVYLGTGTVENKILPKASGIKSSYQTCYNQYKSSSSGLALIDAIYKCAWDKNYNFASFDFTKLFTKYAKESGQVDFKSTKDTKLLNYKNMILNNYWGAATVFRKDGNNYIAPLKWSGNVANRKYTVNDIDFKDGDVLIYSIDYDSGLTNPYDGNKTVSTSSNYRYTKEKGYYAFIYLDGKFVGVNYSGKSNERNEFTYEYYNKVYGSSGYGTHLYEKYDNIKNNKNLSKVLSIANYESLLDKDYFIILRPEIVIATDTPKATATPTPSPTVKPTAKPTPSPAAKPTPSPTVKPTTKPTATVKPAVTPTIKPTTKPTVVPTPVSKRKKGDVDGDDNVGSSDYILVRKHLLKSIQLTGDRLAGADVNGDGFVTSHDYIAIRKIILNK